MTQTNANGTQKSRVPRAYRKVFFHFLEVRDIIPSLILWSMILVEALQNNVPTALPSTRTRIVSNTRKFDRERELTHFRRSQLHWALADSGCTVVDRVRFRVCVQVFRCLYKMAPVVLLPTRLRHFAVATCDRLTVVTYRFHTCEI